MVTQIREFKTQAPNTHEQSFIDVVRNIITHPGANALDIEKLKGEYKEYAQWLEDAAQSGGQTDFWKVWETLERNKHKLRRFRKAVEVPPDPNQKSQFAGTLLSDVKPEKVKWLWKHRLALGKMTMLDGDPGLGKSLIGAHLSACITSDTMRMPDGSPCMERGGVVIIMPEDGLEDTIQPRFQRAGAVLNKVSSIGEIADINGDGNTLKRSFQLPDDLPRLEAEIIRVQAKLVYIDPLTAILGGKDTYKDTEVRAMLQPLKALVEKHKVSCIMVRHLTKSRGDNPLMAGGGSIAFIGLARTGLMVIRNPENEEEIILSHIKSNIGKIAPGLTFTIASDEEDDDDRPYIVWGNSTSLSGADLMTTPRKNTGNNRQEIKNLLKERAPDDVTFQDIAEALPEMKESNLKVTLKRMYDSKEIGKSERGLYHAL